jgi:hypothetical protein
MKELLKNIYNNLNIQKFLIHNIDWDYLIILDACRYDYFKEVWDYTKVYPVYSPASSTVKWLSKVFPNYYDYELLSSNPYIGSKKSKYWKYQAYEHFKKIHDLWLHCWSEDKGTIKPISTYLISMDIVKPKSIIWFLQPHAPYLKITNKTNYTYDDFKEAKLISKEMRTNLPDIKELYLDNLERVIKYAYKLFNELEPPIMITSDHGELLGEYNKIGHPNIRLKELRKVPFVYLGDN